MTRDARHQMTSEYLPTPYLQRDDACHHERDDRHGSYIHKNMRGHIQVVASEAQCQREKVYYVV
jgi:hypothetical protein